jgi:hypothetical protein
MSPLARSHVPPRHDGLLGRRGVRAGAGREVRPRGGRACTSEGAGRETVSMRAQMAAGSVASRRAPSPASRREDPMAMADGGACGRGGGDGMDGTRMGGAGWGGCSRMLSGRGLVAARTAAEMPASECLEGGRCEGSSSPRWTRDPGCRGGLVPCP